MTFKNELLENREYIVASIIQLIQDERTRIVESGVATDPEVVKFIQAGVKRAMDNRNIDDLTSLHRNLKSFILPGDLTKIAEDEAEKVEEDEEILMDLSSLPKKIKKPEGDDFYDLTGVLEKIEEIRKQEESPEDKMAKKMTNELQKIAHSLGAKGEHKAAHMIEQTIRAILRDAQNGNLMQEKK